MPLLRPKWLVLARTGAVTLFSANAMLVSVSLIAAAHQVEIADDIGGTLHIEPSDTPRAGEEALVWVALTRQGGDTIQLAECDCQMAVYTQPKQSDVAPILSPALSAVASEGYQGIPGANVTFPTVGLYTIAISGSPKQADDFSPFELAFDVTVAAGHSSSESATDSATVPPSPDSAISLDASAPSTAASEAVGAPDMSTSDVSAAKQRPVLALFLGGIVIGAIAFLVIRRN